MKRVISHTPAFVRAAKRLIKKHPRTNAALRETLELLAADVSDPRLKTHKLKGNRAECWACSGGYDLRIVFKFVRQGEEEIILLLSVGTHDEVY